VPIVLESGNLNFLEPSGPVQACNRIADCRASTENYELYTHELKNRYMSRRKEGGDLFNSSKVKCGLDRIDLFFGKVGSNLSYTSFIIHGIKMSHVHKVSAIHVVCCTPFPKTWLLYVCICAYQKFHKWPQNKDYNKQKCRCFQT